MYAGNFRSFAQKMFNAGLVFNIQFMEEELEQLPHWSLFDCKIMNQITALPGVMFSDSQARPSMAKS